MTKDHYNWESWVRTLAGSKNPKDIDLLIAKLSLLLHSGEAKERYKRCKRCTGPIHPERCSCSCHFKPADRQRFNELINKAVSDKDGCCQRCRENPPSGDDYCTAKGCDCHSKPTEVEKKTDCELYEHTPQQYDGAFWHCKVCDAELHFVANKAPVEVGEWEEEFESEWKHLIDWAGSGFRYDDASFTARGLDVMKPRFKSLIEKVRVEGREVSSLQGEDGKLFSRVIAKCFEAPFPEVAVMHAMRRVDERARKEAFEAGRRQEKGVYDPVLSWLLGEADLKDRGPQEGAYWWCIELRKRLSRLSEI